MGMLRHTSFFLPLPVRKLVYSALILPHITYCITVWSSTSTASLNKLDVLLNKVCRSVLLVRWNELHTTELYSTLDWLTIKQLISFNLIKICHRIVHHSSSLSCIMPPLNIALPNERDRRHTNNFIVPRYNTNSGLKSPSYRMLHLWNSLPLSIKLISNHSLFKRKVYVYLKENN